MIIAGIEFNPLLVKALAPNPVQEQAQQAGVSQHSEPSVAAMHSASPTAPAAAAKPAGPAGMRQPRAGHRYVSRKWNSQSGKWEYCYPGEEGCDMPKEGSIGPGAFPQDLSHTMEYNEAFQGAANPEHAYHRAMESALRQLGEKIPVHHPAFPGKNPGDPGLMFEVINSKQGNRRVLAVKHSDGRPVMVPASTRGASKTAVGEHKLVPLSFKTRGEAEKWWLETSNSKVIRDHQGRDWLHITPNMGVLSKPSQNYPYFSESNFTPYLDAHTGSSTPKHFRLSINPLHPTAAAAEAQRGSASKEAGVAVRPFTQHNTLQDAYREAAKRSIDDLNLHAQQTQDPEELQQLHKTSKMVARWLRRTHPRLRAWRKEVGKEDTFVPPEDTFKTPWDDISTAVSSFPLVDTSLPGSVAHRMESGQLKHRLSPDQRDTELDVSPEEKHKLINETLREFWPHIHAQVDLKAKENLARTQGYGDIKNVPEGPELQAERQSILGSQFDPGIPGRSDSMRSLPADFELTPNHPFLGGEHPIYSAIARNLDSYPHIVGYPFAMHMRGNWIKGKLDHWLAAGSKGVYRAPKKETALAEPQEQPFAQQAAQEEPEAPETREEYHAAHRTKQPRFWIGTTDYQAPGSDLPGSDRGVMDDIVDDWLQEQPGNPHAAEYAEQLENLRDGADRNGHIPTIRGEEVDIPTEEAYDQIRHGILKEIIDPKGHDRLHRVLPILQRSMEPEEFKQFVYGLARNPTLAQKIQQYATAGMSPEAVQAMQAQIAKQDVVEKAMSLLQKDKNVPPDHKYSFMEGDDDHPRFFYKDARGNVLRYTNAPTGESDRANHHGDPRLHPSEPTFEKYPQYFTPDGRKLTRCPECEAEQVEWNSKYNRYDPSNLWAARWRDKKTGAYRYSYIHSDIRNVPKLQINQQNAIVDVRLPQLRNYYTELYHNSDKYKDQLTGIALALLDQGRCRAIELASLSGKDLQIEGSLVSLGNRKIYTDPELLTSFTIVQGNTPPDMPLFSVPMQNKDKLDFAIRRRMGPHYWARVLDMQGISLLGLQTYHATMTFSREINRLLVQGVTNWDQAEQFATLVVAFEWGHDFSAEPDPLRILDLVKELLVDPVVVSVLKRNAQAQGMIGRSGISPPQPSVQVPYVSMNLTTRLPEETEFSQWIHSAPVHEYADIPAPKQPPRPALDPMEGLISDVSAA